MVNSADRQGITFRRYAPEDLQACTKLAEEAWPPGPDLATKDVVSWGMEGYIESSLMNANWTEIAYDSQGVVGFLFGRMDKYHGEAAVAGSLFGELPMLAKHIVGRYRKTPRILVLFWTLLLTELKLKINMPRSDSEIRLFMKSVLWRPPNSSEGGSRSPDPPQLLIPDIPRHRFRRHMPHRPNVIALAPQMPLPEHRPQDWMLVEQHPRADPFQSLYDPDRRFRRWRPD